MILHAGFCYMIYSQVADGNHSYMKYDCNNMQKLHSGSYWWNWVKLVRHPNNICTILFDFENLMEHDMILACVEVLLKNRYFL